jgi:hypothetical protein
VLLYYFIMIVKILFIGIIFEVMFMEDKNIHHMTTLEQAKKKAFLMVLTCNGVTLLLHN